MNKFINSNIGLLFALTMLICAAGVEGMTYEEEQKFSPKEQQAFDEIFGKEQEQHNDTTSDNSNQE